MFDRVRGARRDSIGQRGVALLFLGLVAASGLGGARYTEAGDFRAPGDYREWVFLSSGLDMSYRAGAPMKGQSMFDNVFVDPVAWAVFKRTGHWPDGAMFAMENRGAASHGSINRNGQYQTTERMGVEYHVRDEARFKGGWAFFALDDDGRTKFIPASADCYACHRQNGALNTTFTQFYPTARVIAERAGTMNVTVESGNK